MQLYKDHSKTTKRTLDIINYQPVFLLKQKKLLLELILPSRWI